EAWARFLARVARVPSEAATERDLRVFLFDRYPRTTRADELRARSVPGSLGRYFRYLAEHEGIAYPWAPAVLRERPAFRDRMETAPLGRDLEEAREWRAELFADLDDRVMLPAPGFPGEHTGEAPPASPRVAALAHELGRRWLLWRDEAVREGIADPAALRAALVRRQRAWERDPHPEHGASPLRVAADAEAGGDGFAGDPRVR
ncbi:MAG TPA: hypothetical protein VHG91_04740, partial [Longimicrobium sp.]|nr:hypothetical protein [Longimicrobium sp.]